MSNIGMDKGWQFLWLVVVVGLVAVAPVMGVDPLNVGEIAENALPSDNTSWDRSEFNENFNIVGMIVTGVCMGVLIALISR